MNVLVRPARRGDGKAMSRIFLAAARAAWTHFLPAEGLARLSSPPERWERDIWAGPRVVALVAERGEEVIGFAVIRPSQDPDADPGRTGELDTIYALPAVWASGIGRALLEGALGALRGAGFEDATLWTAIENARSRRFYEGAGWRPDGAERQKAFAGAEFVELRYRISLRAGGGEASGRARSG